MRLGADLQHKFLHVGELLHGAVLQHNVPTEGEVLHGANLQHTVSAGKEKFCVKVGNSGASSGIVNSEKANDIHEKFEHHLQDIENTHVMTNLTSPRSSKRRSRSNLPNKS